MKSSSTSHFESQNTPYHIEHGKEYMMNHRLKRKQFFTGACYLCGQLQHLQALCPLRRCQKCFALGHSEHVCKKKMYEHH